MNHWCRIAALVCIAAAPAALSAQQGTTAPRKQVLFVCEHGTVKSVLAMKLFDEYAAKVGLRMNAVSRGTLADSAVPPWMLKSLAADQMLLGSWKPQTLKARDLANASLVVSFDVPPAATARTRAPQAHWDGLPSVGADYAKGRDAIKVRVYQLVDSLKRAELPATDPTRTTIMAVVDSALHAINAGNLVGLADLMVPEAQMYPAREREGKGTYNLRTAAELRARAEWPRIIERGFDGDVRVSGTVAVVWLPYDLYAADKWSHCGVDVFTLVRVGAAWRIANLTYSIEQPPACRTHPSGPPAGLKAP